MAMDSSWDNSGLPPQKKGMPTWVKILGGCGIVFLLLLGGCVALGFYGVHKVSEMGKAQWPRYVETVKELQDPASTKALYEANPGLHTRFSDEDAFERQVAEWRPAIQAPPAEMPSLTSGRAMAFEGRNHTVHIQVGSGETPDTSGKTSVAGYKMDDGRMFVVVWRNDQISDIRFQEGNQR